jgi:hypothetical protein
VLNAIEIMAGKSSFSDANNHRFVLQEKKTTFLSTFHPHTLVYASTVPTPVVLFVVSVCLHGTASVSSQHKKLQSPKKYECL